MDKPICFRFDIDSSDVTERKLLFAFQCSKWKKETIYQDGRCYFQFSWVKLTPPVYPEEYLRLKETGVSNDFYN